MDHRARNFGMVLGIFITVLGLLSAFDMTGAQAAEEICIGFLAPLTGPLAKPGEDLVNGSKLFWE